MNKCVVCKKELKENDRIILMTLPEQILLPDGDISKDEFFPVCSLSCASQKMRTEKNLGYLLEEAIIEKADKNGLAIQPLRELSVKTILKVRGKYGKDKKVGVDG
jgi:hypothetical protein